VLSRKSIEKSAAWGERPAWFDFGAARIGFRIVGSQTLANQRQLRPGFGQRYTRPEARKNIQAAMRFAILHGFFSDLTERCKYIRYVPIQPETRRSDADYAVWLSVKNQWRTEHCRVSTVAPHRARPVADVAQLRTRGPGRVRQFSKSKGPEHPGGYQTSPSWLMSRTSTY
jgi:hypothetical protein